MRIMKTLTDGQMVEFAGALHDALNLREEGGEPTWDCAHDHAATVRILGLCGDVAGGAVRCYPLTEMLTDIPTGGGAAGVVEPGAGLWKGDRLAVLPSFRRNGLGAPLVRFAVRTAAEAGGRQMIAHIQPSNVGFFEHLGWYTVGGPVSFVGRPHQMMAIDLALILRRL